MEAAYQGYLQRKGLREQATMAKQAKRARLGDPASEDDLDSDTEDQQQPPAPQAPADSDEEVGQQQGPVNHFMPPPCRFYSGLLPA